VPARARPLRGRVALAECALEVISATSNHGAQRPGLFYSDDRVPRGTMTSYIFERTPPHSGINGHTDKRLPGPARGSAGSTSLGVWIAVMHGRSHALVGFML